jgi:cytochrome c556
MNRLTKIGVAATLAAVSAVVAAQAVTKAASQADADKAIKARQAIFNQINDLNKPIGPMLRPNGPPVDTALVATTAAKIAELATQIPGAYLVDTRGFTATKTRALDGIWASQADFKTKADALATAAKAAADAAKTGDAAATKTAMQTMGRACGSCHDTFRGPPIQ